MADKPLFPMRINRALAYYGLATRREADLLIKDKQVLINGRTALLGEKVQATDKITLSSDERGRKSHRYVAYYKPRGIITHSPQRKERAIKEVAPFAGTFPVGRLDKDSEGLIILTDDGRITDRLLNPKYAHEKEYRVRVRERVPVNAPALLQAGVESEGEKLVAKKVTRRSERELSIVLTEGKKHQIRRMLDALHLTVERLTRVRIMGISLGALEPGAGRKLVGEARRKFLADLGLSESRQ